MGITDIFRITQIKAERDSAIAERDVVRNERDVLKETFSRIEHLNYQELNHVIADLSKQKEALIQEHHQLVEQLAQQKQAHEQQMLADTQTFHTQHDALLAEYEKQKRTIAQELDDLTAFIDEKKNELHQELANKQSEFAQTMVTLQKELDEKKRELVQTDEELLLQSFGFYTPRFNFASAEDYKVRLEQTRKQQEEMIKLGQAALASQSWTINNNRQEGERMVKDYIKLIIRSFNNECDACMVGVKFNNIESSEKRIRKAFSVLNTLGKRMTITIALSYLDLKIQELYLYHEYQLKKQQEKEEQKQLREQMREEARVQKELEELKSKVAKEETHFTKALNAIDERIQRAETEAEQALLTEEKASILEQIDRIEHTKQDIRNREQNTRAGYVYIISNLGSFGEHVYKIGVTRRLDPQERVDELGDASVPFTFDVHALIFSEDAPALENALHKAFEHRRLNMINRRREFFHVTLEEIKQVVTMHFKKPVEFIELADAPEYRQSLRIKHPQGNLVIPERTFSGGVPTPEDRNAPVSIS